ncbi:RnfABCDGE type electron transport complex subunit G [bacterium]|nr:RnfABCDGE type electron transport complex subunit G [bacterium]
MREIGRLILVLGLIGVGSATSLAWVRATLAERIEQQEDLYVRGPALSRLFSRPADELLANKVKISTDSAEYPVFYLQEGGELSGLAVQAAGQGGYGGDIVMMVGIDVQEDELVGVEVVSHSETPGVGAKVEKADFRSQWEDLTATEHVQLRSAGGSIDAISGATFSSQAMVNGTNQVVDLLRDHRDEILARIDERIGAGGES